MKNIILILTFSFFCRTVCNGQAISHDQLIAPPDTVVVTPPRPTPIDTTVTPNTNRIIRKTYTNTVGKEPQHFDDVTYYDGLGYPEQVIQVKGSPNEKNIITPVYYDNMRRNNARVYLPYVSAGNMAKKDSLPFEKQLAFYQNEFGIIDAQRAYVENVFEDSPLNRVSHTFNVGSVYWNNNKKSVNNYETNSANEVFLLKVDANNNLSIARYYEPGTLYKNTVTNEDLTIIIT